MEKTIPRHIIIKLLKTCDEEKMVKAVRTKQNKTKDTETKIRMTADISRNDASQKIIRDLFKVLVWGGGWQFVHLVFYIPHKNIHLQ